MQCAVCVYRTLHYLAVFLEKTLAKFVYHKAGAQFRLEPSGFGRHDVAGVGNVDNLFHGNGIESKSHFHLAAVHTTFQLAQSADTANEVDTLVGTQVFDTQHFVQNKVAEDGNIEHSDGVGVVVGAGLGGEAVPHSLEIH